jgi:hypothetical protein
VRASACRITIILGAGIVVIAVKRFINTTRGGVTRIRRTEVFVVALFSLGFATNFRIARVD